MSKDRNQSVGLAVLLLTIILTCSVLAAAPNQTAQHSSDVQTAIAVVQTATAMAQPTPTPNATETLAAAISVLATATSQAQGGHVAGTLETMTRSADSMIMVHVPAGEFEMGSTDADVDKAMQVCQKYSTSCKRESFEAEQPAHPVALGDFWLDRTEVTNAQFERFVQDLQFRTLAEEKGYGWVLRGNTWEMVAGAEWRHPGGPETEISGAMDHPVVQVSWDEAAAYCKWAGARLPTEAEWEYGARGPAGSTWPWGNVFDGTRLNYCDVSCQSRLRDRAFNDEYATTAPVGNYPDGASWCGVLDLAGNVWEWVADWFGNYESGPQADPTGPGSGDWRLLRGGSWAEPSLFLRGAFRFEYEEEGRHNDIGFRCAKSAPTSPSGSLETPTAEARETMVSRVLNPHRLEDYGWFQRHPDPSPGPRRDCALAYDSWRDVFVLFGGDAGNHRLLSDTWEWNGAAWRKVASGGLPPRAAGAMAFDARRRVVVLFGGYDGSYLDDTWEYDGVRWLRREVGPRPSGRLGAGMVYDDVRGVMVLFGGDDRTGESNETWTYDGRSWTRQPTGSAPGPRSAVGMAYDRQRRVAVLFGGSDDAVHNDTWEWDGSGWEERQIAEPPPKRGAHALVYHDRLGKVLLLGGISKFGSCEPEPKDAWAWDGTSWQRMLASAPGTAYGAAAYSPRLDFGTALRRIDRRLQPDW